MKKEKKLYIKNEKMFNSKWQMVLYLLLFAIIIFLFIYIGKIDFKGNKTSAQVISEKFSLLDDNNVFELTNASTVRMIVSGGSGIVVFGVENEWVNYYLDIVNRAAKAEGIEKIYYYDFTKNRQDNNGTYEDIVKKLENYLMHDDYNRIDIYAPTIIVVSDGRIILFDDETSFVRGDIKPSNYWNIFTKNIKIDNLRRAFREYLGG